MRRALLAVALLLLVRVASAGDLHHITGFDEYAENHDGVAKALTRHPSLASDPEYLSRHPSLEHYLHDNPLARTELEDEDDEFEDNELHAPGRKDLTKDPEKLEQ